MQYRVKGWGLVLVIYLLCSVARRFLCYWIWQRMEEHTLRDKQRFSQSTDRYQLHKLLQADRANRLQITHNAAVQRNETLKRIGS